MTLEGSPSDGPYAGLSISLSDLPYGFSFSTFSSAFNNVFNIKISKGLGGVDVGFVVKFGPQGRNFDNDPIIDIAIAHGLNEFGIALGSIQISADLVSIEIGGALKSYSRSTINTVFIDDITFGSENEDLQQLAETAALVIGGGMDAFKIFANLDEYITVPVPNFSPQEDFQAKFEKVASVTLDLALSGVQQIIEIFGDNYITVTDVSSGQDARHTDVFYNATSNYTAEETLELFLEALEENPSLDIRLFLLEYVPFEHDGAYIEFPFKSGLKDAIDELGSVLEGNSTDTNEAPIVINPLEDQSGHEEAQLNFLVPEDTFIDLDGDALILTATLADGSDLPDWLSFDSETGIFGGVPPLDSSGDISVIVNASDGYLSTSDEFTLTVFSDDSDENGGGGGSGTATWAGSVEGTEGADIIDANFLDAEGEVVGNTADTIYGFGGDDTINSGNGDDIIYGGDGNDNINGARGSNIIEGGNGDDIIYVIDSSIVDGGAGDDYLFSNLNKGGDHVFTGGTGADTFEFYYAGAQAAIQTITDFEVGVDTLIIQGQMLSGLLVENLPIDFTTSVSADGSLVLNYGGIHSVTLSNMSAEEFFVDIGVTAAATVGTADDDVIDASYVDVEGDTISDGAETIFGLGGNDTINSGKGNDAIYGGDGNDTINPDRGSKTIYGENGDDTIYVIDSSVVDGGAGDDYLFSNLNKGGDHIFTGGTGADTFEFAYAGGTKAAIEVITDFEVGIDALIVDGQTLSALTAAEISSTYTTSTAADGSLVLSYGGIHSVTLEGVTEAEFFSL